jgi:hypothetical protein
MFTWQGAHAVRGQVSGGKKPYRQKGACRAAGLAARPAVRAAARARGGLA